MKWRIEELDALRGLAALAVVLYHYSYQYHNLFGHTSEVNLGMRYGYLGVHLFFMISGFVIFMTLEKTKRPLDFIASRVSRLYPVYWVSMVITASVVAIFGLPGQETNFIEFLINFSMVQGLLLVKHVDGVYWTLQYELVFYFLMFCCLVTGWISKVRWFIAALLLINLAVTAGLGIRWAVQMLFITSYSHLFIAGILFYLLKTQSKPITDSILLLACLALVWFKHPLIESTFITSFFVIFTLMLADKLKFLSHRALVWLGGLSYSLYLIHQNVGFVIIQQLQNHHVPAYLSVFIATACTLLLSILLCYLVEKPALNWLRVKYRERFHAKTVVC